MYFLALLNLQVLEPSAQAFSITPLLHHPTVQFIKTSVI